MYIYPKSKLMEKNFLKDCRSLLFLALTCIIMAGCAGNFELPDWVDAEASRERAQEREQKRDGGPSGKIQNNLLLFQSDTADKGASIGVNALLWRASLDTVSFMPLEQADPYGGIIMTEWYINPENPNERYKIIIYILDTRLRADALRVSFFMQQLIDGEWVNKTTSDETRISLENSILTKARQFKQE